MSRGYWSRMLDHFQALAGILDFVTHLALMSYWYRSDKLNLDDLKLLCCEFGQPKKNVNTSYNATKNMERTFQISD